MDMCRSVSCTSPTHGSSDFCQECIEARALHISEVFSPSQDEQSMSQKYPKYYKQVGDMTEIDVYAVHYLFNIQDPSGAVHHASKKLLLSGVRTGGKSAYQDIKEARDALNRWLQLNADTK